ncbi:MAG TPA: hypothetical protein VFF52_07090 [Isosphaeraceae bacterium]|nr:hypothetical protein [Isosphaeraceae bacterium]
MFLGKIAAKQNLSGIVVKLARETGEKAKEETTRVTGVVTRDGKPVAGGGRVGGWQKRPKEMNRVNAAIERGRTIPMDGFEFAWSRVGPDGTYALERLKAGPWFGPWYFVYEEPGRAPTVVGPVTITSKDRSLKVDIPLDEGGAIEGRVTNVPAAMAGQVWVIAFDAGVIRRESLVAADNTFRLENLPPGRYGLKAGHDAYVDPHVPRWKAGEKPDPAMWQKSAEPWQGAVTVTVEPGRTARGVILDYRPPGPIVDKEPSPPPKPAR